ncbi:MAG: hypothetical protein HOL22_04795 [Euryarchaeota archaeon]|nr:hypothetical protein [Euryarchaeota archaeon]
MASTFLLFQVASVSALVGMTLGWRGVMTRYSGFYDLPTAWSNVFWGILIGGFYGSFTHNFIVVPYIEMVLNDQAAVVNPLNLLILCLMASVAVHLLLRRDRVRKGSSQTTSGWALGLAMGGMLAMVFILRILEMFEFNISLVITILCLALFGPRCEALISSFQGHLMLQGKRWGAVFRGAFWRCAYVVMFSFALVNLSAWLFIIPVALLFNRTSETWIWDSLPKESKKRLRKIWARNARERDEKNSEIETVKSNSNKPNQIIQNITIKDSVVTGNISGFSSDDAAAWDAGGGGRIAESE